MNPPYSRDQKVFFLHIPKTAGVALNDFIESHFARDEVYPVYRALELPGLESSNVSRYRYFRGHLPFGLIQRVLSDDVVSLTMLRDPVERFISNFAFIQENPELPIPFDRQWFGSLSFDEYVSDPGLVARVSWLNMQTTYLVNDIDPITLARLGIDQQHHPAVSASAAATVAKELLDEFAFVGLTERFEESLFLLCYLFAWRPLPLVEPQNVTRRRPRRAHLAPAVLEQVARYNALDLEVYEHARCLFECRYAAMFESLLDRYGRRAQAASDVRPTKERVYQLLEEHYRDHFEQTHPVVESVRVDLACLSRSPGWQLLEADPTRGPFRWTGPGTTSELDLRLDSNRNSRIRLRIMMSLAADVLDGLRLQVNGCAVPLVRSEQADGTTAFEGVILGEAIARGQGMARVSLLVDRTIVPETVIVGSTDRRRLGVAVSSIEIEPA